MNTPSLSATVAALLTLSSFTATAACSSAGDSNVEQSDASLRTSDGGADGASTSVDGGDGGEGSADGGAANATFVDPRDGQTYPTQLFGAKVWFSRNLNFATAGSYCYDDDPASCDEDGRLYTFSAAQSACPAGWRLATDEDWGSLEHALGMETDQLDLEGYTTVRGTNEGTKLKDPAGFAAKPAGFRSGSAYDARGNRTYFWTASTRGGDVWRRRVGVADSTIFRFTNPPQGFAISVRCMKDLPLQEG